jgi:hypothetical protein
MRARWMAALVLLGAAVVVFIAPVPPGRADYGRGTTTTVPTTTTVAPTTTTGPTTTSTSTTTVPPAPTNALVRWASTNGGGGAAQSITAAQAVADARNYDLIVALQQTFVAPNCQPAVPSGPSCLAAMRAANPRLVVLAYLNGAYAQSGQGPSTGAYPQDLYLKGPQGQYVVSNGFGNYLMNVADSRWRANRTALCAQYVAASGYDGCYLDELGLSSLNAPSYVNAAPMNPATGAPWTAFDWLTATGGVATAVKSGTGVRVTGNGLANGGQYFDLSSQPPAPTSMLIGPLDGANAQGFVRNEGAAIDRYRGPAAWKQDVDMLVDAGNRGKYVMTMTKIGVSATAAQVRAWQRYALATFLLGTNGREYFFFDPDGIDGAVAYDDNDLHAVVGMPSEAYQASSGAYLRHFSSGVAVVNPTAATVGPISLGGTYTDLDGQTMSSVTLPPNTGMVFTLSAAGPPPTTTTTRPLR